MSSLVGREYVRHEFRHEVISLEFFTLMIGDHLGSGTFREVFTMRHDPKIVIKFEMSAGSFHNISEWQTWHRLKKTDAGKFLAPA